MQQKDKYGISRRKALIGAAASVAAIAVSSTAAASQAGQPAEVRPAQELAGKRALVTGASRGIGAGIALALADKGADVVITYLNSPEKAAEVVQAIEAKGRRALALRADSADPAAVKRSIEETVKRLGGLDILVNNVGISRDGTFAEMSLTDIDALFNVNARAAVLASQAAIPHLKKGGRIVTVGSCVAERVPFPGLTVYSMTKSALLAFTRGLARELGPQDITVNLVQPGPIDTDQNPADGAWADINRSLTSLGRYGTPADVAAAVTFLASPAAGFMTGSVVTVDAGFNA
ncbi:MAG: 3-oxoacyl-ACP reductase FabG [Gammaproteobacteria bacterium]|nr:3-oxoacyl-ACP reductase FabG [Gammaproteobacteria bacterium]MBU1488813.1 3-oxoacyl-ACP reductase FabG [Gammaproteobacteria bacterium]MBU2218077.1 3-oxoacyl-ACP reductase FabG [Gammaproteobacteria bacterium]MBU2322693.1 3-oxoacyl-ACP reductase FabG [Gammaproteobacteria bacterium]